MKEEKSLDEIFEEIGSACYGHNWSKKCIKALERNSTPEGNSIKRVRYKDTEHRHKALQVKRKLLRFLKNPKTKIGIRTDKRKKFSSAPEGFHFRSAYIPDSYLITNENEEYECVVYIDNKNYLRSRRKAGEVRPGRKKYEVDVYKPLVEIIINNTEGKISVSRIRKKLLEICKSKGLKCPKKDWIYYYCDDLLKEARRNKF